MKKTYKMYVAPEAEMIEMQMPVVLMASDVPDVTGGGIPAVTEDQ